MNRDSRRPGTIPTAIWLLFLSSTCAAQQLPADRLGVVIFDLNVKDIQATVFGHDVLEFAEKQTSSFEGFVPKRVLGVANMPPSLDFMKRRRPPEAFPFDFYIRGIFEGEYVAEDVLDVVGMMMKSEMIDGKEYKSALGNLLGHLRDESTVEIGTRDYLRQTKPPVTPALVNAWKPMPKTDVRIAIDMQRGRAGVEQLMEYLFRINDVPDAATAPMKLVLSKVSYIAVGVDFSSGDLVNIKLQTENAADADAVLDVVKPIVELAKTQLLNNMSRVREQGEQHHQAAEVMETIANTLVAESDSQAVRIRIPLPKDFANLRPPLPKTNKPQRHVEPVITEYDTSPLGNFETRENLADFKQTLESEIRAATFFDTVFPARDSHTVVRMNIDPLSLANLSLCDINYAVKSVQTIDGKNVLAELPDKQRPSRLFINSQDYGIIDIPVVNDVETTELKTADVEFTITAAPEVRVFDLDLQHRRVVSGNSRVKVRLQDGMVMIFSSNIAKAELFAFDETGGRLRSRGGMGIGSVKMKQFAGHPVRFKVIASAGTPETFQFTANFDLNGGEKYAPPFEPTMDVRLRKIRMPAEVPVFTTEAIDSLAFVTEAGSRETHVVRLVPRDLAQKLKHPANSLEWKRYSFGQSEPLPEWILHDTTEVPTESETRVVFGTVDVTVNTDVEIIRFKKIADAKPIVATSESGEEFTVSIDHNQVMFPKNNQNIIQSYALNSQGDVLRPYEFGRFGERERPEDMPQDLIVYFGQVNELVLVISINKASKRLAFEESFGEFDKEAYQSYKHRIAIIDEMTELLVEITDSLQNAAGYDAKLAGLYYVHDPTGKPMHAIDEEVARSDTTAAEVFNYEPKPYKGYHLQFADYYHGADENGNYHPRYNEKSKLHEFSWNGGNIKAPKGTGAEVIANPVDPDHPTFFLTTYPDFKNNGKLVPIVYYKLLNGEQLNRTLSFQELRTWTRLAN